MGTVADLLNKQTKPKEPEQVLTGNVSQLLEQNKPQRIAVRDVRSKIQQGRSPSRQDMETLGVSMNRKRRKEFAESARRRRIQDFGKRPDGTTKGMGFFGELPVKGGGVATEYSVGVQLEGLGGKETDIPTLVPTLTRKERDLLLNDIIPNKKPIPDSIVQKAVDHANKRVGEGKNVFFQEGEDSPAQYIRERFGAIGAGMGGFAPTMKEKKDLAAGVAEAPKSLWAGVERLLGVPGAMAQWAFEKGSIGEVLTKHIDVPGAGIVAEHLIRKYGPKKAIDFYDKKMKQHAETGKKWADFMDEQASMGWEAPSQELMEAKWDRPLQYGARVTFESAPTFIAAIAAGYATGNPNIGLAIMGAFEKLGSYRAQREAGAGVLKADIISTLAGTWEAVTEKIPFDFILKGGGKSRLVKAVFGGSLESLQELLAGMGQNFLEHFGYNAKDWKSIPPAAKEGLKHTFDNWLESVVAGGVLGAGAGTFISGRGTKELNEVAKELGVPIKGLKPEAAARKVNEEIQKRQAVEALMGSELLETTPTVPVEAPIEAVEPIKEAEAPVGEAERKRLRDSPATLIQGDNVDVFLERASKNDIIKAVDRLTRFYQEFRRQNKKVFDAIPPITQLYEEAPEGTQLYTPEHLRMVVGGLKNAVQLMGGDISVPLGGTIPITPTEEIKARAVKPKKGTVERKIFDAKAKQLGAEITEPPPPLDITEEPPSGVPTAEHGESFIKRVTRRAETALRTGKDYGTPKSLLSNVKGLATKIKTTAKLSVKAQRTIAKEKKAFLRRATYLAGKFVEKEIAKGEMSPAEINDAKIKFFAGEQYAKQRWEPVKIEKEQRDALHEYILQHPALGLLTSRDTAAALNKLLDGYYLTNGEVGMIAEVFPELGMEASKRRAPHNKVLDLFLAVTGIPKTIKASIDISLMGRQAFPLLMAHPSMIAPGTWQSLKLFGRWKSAEYSKALTAEMKADPAWKRAKDMGIAVIQPGELSEEFPTRVAGKIPGIARSERAFIDIGNLLRVGAHSMIEDAYASKGKPLSDDASKALAQAINDLSGRAAMPKDLKGLSIVASTVLWSPRLLIARAKAPFRMFSRNAAARNLAIRSFSTMATIATLLALIAKWGHERNEDIDADLNPLSTDFLKIRWKNQHIDLTAGYGPMIRTVFRLATGMTKTAAGEVREKKRLETIKQFGRAKGAPIVGIARKAITRKDWLGRPAYRPPKGTVGEAMTELGIPDAGQIVLKEFYDELLPLPIVDVADALVIDGMVSGVVAAPLVFGGIGVLAYEPWESTKLRIEQNRIAQKRFGKQWDELGPSRQKQLSKVPALQEQQLKADIEELYQRQEYEIDKVRYQIYRNMPLSVRKELDSIGIAISAPSRSSGDWRMSDKRYDHYVEKSTQLMKEKFTERFAKRAWKNISVKTKQKVARDIMIKAKAKARSEVKRLSDQGKL